MIRPLRKKLFVRAVPREESLITIVDAERDHRATTFYEVLALGAECGELKVGDHVVLQTRCPAFETPSGDPKEAMVHYHHVEGVVG